MTQPFRISACYTYPVKGMTAHAVDSLQLAPGQSVLGDRAFVFAFGNADVIGEHGWVSKRQSVTLLNTPYLALVEAGWDPDQRVLSVSLGEQSKSAQVDDPAARVEIAEWFTDLVLGLPQNPLSGRPEREPLRLLGDGESRFTDRGPTQISLGASSSLADLSNHAGVDVDFRRFRLNFEVDEIDAWGELDWVGKQLTVGPDVVIDVTAPIQRCNAINASPVGEGRDVELMQVLQRAYGHLDFGIEANVLEGGNISVGDEVAIR